MRLLTCGFEAQTLDEMTSQSHNFSTAIVRLAGGLSAQFAATGHYCYQESAAGWDEFYERYCVYLPALTAASRHAYLTYGGGTLIFDFWYGGGTAITIKAGATTLGVGQITIPVNTWHRIEAHFKSEGGLGVLELRQEGVVSFTYRGPIPMFRVGRLNWGAGGVATAQYYDDLALNDVGGARDTDWPGDGYILRLVPNGTGDASDLTGSDGDQLNNYLLVDERPANGDTDYVVGFQEGQKDLYQLVNPSLPGGYMITRVLVGGSAIRYNNFNFERIKLGLKVSGVEDWQLTNLLTAGYRYNACDWGCNPATGLPWTAADMTDLQIGVQISDE